MPPENGTTPIDERVRRVIAETQRLPLENVTMDRSFADLKIDSLDGINIIFALESEFNINIPDDAVSNIRSVRDAVDGVRALVEQKVSAP